MNDETKIISQCLFIAYTTLYSQHTAPEDKSLIYFICAINWQARTNENHCVYQQKQQFYMVIW